MADNYQSWGKYPVVNKQTVYKPYWKQDGVDKVSQGKTVLPRGMGRSQGDCCLNAEGVLFDMTNLDRFISFNKDRGVITCEAGVTLAELLRITVPHGWFLTVTPGTKFVTVGGAIANDVHGKNHHRAGTFGCHVKRFGLVRSDGLSRICSAVENKALYKATIGGMGLTGLITWAEIELTKISSPLVEEEVTKMTSLDDFFKLAPESDERFDFTVAWIDCQARGSVLGKGLYMRGNWLKQTGELGETRSWVKPKVVWPAWSPSLINEWTVKAFNWGFYNKQLATRIRHKVHFNKYFYPLDGVDQWSRVYGKSGFLQYQCVIPRDNGEENLREILGMIASSGLASFLSTLKFFGDKKSPGLMSFPRPGIAFAVDLGSSGSKTLKLLNKLDEIVLSSGGAINPSKDARMSPEMFAASFPKLNEFAQYVDPHFSSSMWRRVSHRSMK